MSFARLIHDYIDDFAASEEPDGFGDFDSDFDSDLDDDMHERRGRRHRRSGRRSGSRRRGPGRHGSRSRSRNRRQHGGGSTKDIVRLVVLAAVALTVIRRLRAGSGRGRGDRRAEYA
jgi:hypothetical protein